MITTRRTSAHLLASSLESVLTHETGDRPDEPEGTTTVVMSATLVREIVRALRGAE